jgi:hypothetical protein
MTQLACKTLVYQFLSVLTSQFEYRTSKTAQGKPESFAALHFRLFVGFVLAPFILFSSVWLKNIENRFLIGAV